MKDSQKPDHVSLANMVGRLREGRYVIPDFQCDFEWEPWDIKELMSSIFRDYYQGPCVGFVVQDVVDHWLAP